MSDDDRETAELADKSATAPEEPGQAVEDWKDKYLRLAAEWDNFRKRATRDLGEIVRAAERDMVSDLTDVYDDFVRAFENGSQQSAEDFARGVAQIKSKFWTALEKRGLERLTTVGTPFNPEEHDALLRVPSDEYDEGIVAQEISPGYRLGGKILRHAKVAVSQGKAG